MAPISYRRHRFPPVVIQHAVWLYLRFTLSYRDVEELLAEHGLDLSYESVRSWVLKFGPAIARGLRRGRPRPSDRWQRCRTYEVLVLDDGFSWQGKHYRSLSALARKITGTAWSGPLFFGLKRTRSAGRGSSPALAPVYAPMEASHAAE